MTTTTQTLRAETGGTDVTRFNALRHGVLSRYTVLPWEDANEYRAVRPCVLLAGRYRTSSHANDSQRPLQTPLP